jgi:hypothetical protein
MGLSNLFFSGIVNAESAGYSLTITVVFVGHGPVQEDLIVLFY